MRPLAVVESESGLADLEVVAVDRGALEPEPSQPSKLGFSHPRGRRLGRLTVLLGYLSALNDRLGIAAIIRTWPLNGTTAPPCAVETCSARTETRRSITWPLSAMARRSPDRRLVTELWPGGRHGLVTI